MTTKFYVILLITGSTQWRSRLRHCTTSRKVAGTIPDGVTGIFHWHNPFCRTVVDSASNRNELSKVLPITGHDGPEGEQMYSSTLPSTSALRWEWVVNAPPDLPPVNTRYPLYRRLGGPPKGQGKSCPPPLPGFDPRTVQHVASSYTDWAIPAPLINMYWL
jgi:hypothetical protein